MRGLGLLAGFVLVDAGCGEPASQTRLAPPDITVAYLYGDIEQAKFGRTLKRFPGRPYFANKASCEAAGKRWGPFHGSLLASLEPSGREPDGYRCWIEAKPLTDGDKVCAVPTDCIGNCVGMPKGLDGLTAQC